MGLHLVGQIIGILFTLLGSSLASRFLGTDGYGTVALGYTVFSISALIGQSGLINGLQRVVPRLESDDRRRRVLATSLSWSGGISLLLAALLVILAPWMSWVFGMAPNFVHVIYILAVAIPINSLGTVLVAYSRAVGRVAYVIMEVAFRPVVIAGGMLLLLKWPTPVIAASAYLLGSLFVLGVGVYGCPDVRQARWFRGLRSELPGLLQVSIPLTGTGLLTIMSQWMDVLMLGLFSSPSEVAVYHLAARIAIVLSIGLRAINTVASPRYSTFYGNRDMDGLQRIYQSSTTVMLVVMLPVATIMVVAADKILHLFGSDFSSAAPILRVLVIGQLVNLAVGSAGQVMVMTQYEKQFFVIQGISLIVNGLCNAVFIPLWGGFGASLATTISVGLTNLFRLFFISKRLGLWPLGRLAWVAAGAAALSGVSSHVFMSNLSVHWLYGLALSSITIILLYGILVLPWLKNLDLGIFRKGRDPSIRKGADL